MYDRLHHGLHLTANKAPHTIICVGIGHSPRECSLLYHVEVPTHTQATVNEDDKYCSITTVIVYASEVWECHKAKVVETVHLDFCNKINK